jgi:hypothetical protein
MFVRVLSLLVAGAGGINVGFKDGRLLMRSSAALSASTRQSHGRRNSL